MSAEKGTGDRPRSGPPAMAAATKAKDKVHALILITTASQVNCAPH